MITAYRVTPDGVVTSEFTVPLTTLVFDGDEAFTVGNVTFTEFQVARLDRTGAVIWRRELPGQPGIRSAMADQDHGVLFGGSIGQTAIDFG